MIDKLYVFSEIPSEQEDVELSGNIDNEKRLEWTIDNETKQKLKTIHSSLCGKSKRLILLLDLNAINLITLE